MFTTKYITYERSALQNAEAGAPTFYDRHEQISGGYEFISQEIDPETQQMVVHAHREGGAPGCTWGPVRSQDSDPEKPAPRPTLYVMNESGATVAKYDL